ncbi:MAG: dephospho-CoA kinase [Spirochaetaceae bacterium]|jgi:dephospho-CoA kinase|nr:dephospho-CoA kinase [Spirochaetaceae bacterium]
MNNGRLLLGLTGLYCAGKNFAGEILERKGFAVLDADKLGHIALENRKEAVAERFGSGVLRANGHVDRRALGERVFGKPDELAALENIVHPEVNGLTLEWIASHGDRDRAINAALLHKSCAFTMLDAIIFIKAPYIARMLRARKRDGLSLKEIMRRFGSQRFDVYYSCQKTDIYYISNCGFGFYSRLNPRRLEKRLDEILSALRG